MDGGHYFNVKRVREKARICKLCHQPTWYSSACKRCKDFAAKQAEAMGVVQKPVAKLEKGVRRK